MPTLTQEQLDDIELTIQDLLDQLDMVENERDALKAEVLRLRERMKTD